MSKISITVTETCRANTKKYTNFIKYDDSSYDYPAYVFIDGFTNKYEYALLNKKDYEIIYVYIAYPDVNDENYNMFLKKNKEKYSKLDTLIYSLSIVILLIMVAHTQKLVIVDK